MASADAPADVSGGFDIPGLDLGSTFQTKFAEYGADLLETFPEFEAPIRAALALDAGQRIASYKTAVFTATRSVSAATHLEKTPGVIFPGVTIEQSLWETLGRKTKLAIIEYLSILNLCVAFQGLGGGETDSEDFTREWAERVMREARASMSKLDFEGLSQTFFKAFGTKGENLPPLPEKFLKGKLAKLAEDMVKEFKPEDFGLSAEELEACEHDPTRAFEILMSASVKNPAMIQTAMMRVAKKLQDKVRRGELRPQELVAEATELMEEFKTHPAFVDLMESFKGAFSFNDPEEARAAGRDNEGRLASVQARLRKKLEAKKAGAGAGRK